MTATFLNVAEARRIARRRLPRIFFDYIDGGSHGETTLAANVADFDRVTLEQRVLADVSRVDLSSQFLGRRHPLPLVLGPVGYTGLYARHGEYQAARAAHAAGIAYAQSSFSITAIDHLARHTKGPLWFQLYMLKNRDLTEILIQRAERAGADVLVLTVDTAVTPLRERDERNGFRRLESLTPGLVARFALKPGWCLDRLASGWPKIGALADNPEYGDNLFSQSKAIASEIDPALTWSHVAALRERWRGKLVLKGIMSPVDASRAIDAGADGIIVSNHGGRQLDGAASTISVLPKIAAAADGRICVALDSGVRRGVHVVKALALGADAVLLGRSYIFGLAAGGEAGVARIISLFEQEIAATLALMGLSCLGELKERRPFGLLDR